MTLAMTSDIENSLDALTTDAADVVPVGGAPAAPTNIAEAQVALEAEYDALRGQYRPETVTALLDLLDGAADQVAALERERWAHALRSAARGGTALAQETRAGLHMAASMLERNRPEHQR